MSRKAAIIGLGERGSAWAEMFRAAGWRVSGFDPEPGAKGLADGSRGWRREETISRTVAYSDWIVCCVPDRLELMRKVMQRVQAEAPEGAVIAVASELHDVDAVQGCAVRPAQVIRVGGDNASGHSLFVTTRNAQDLKVQALAVLSEVCPSVSEPEAVVAKEAQPRESRSA